MELMHLIREFGPVWGPILAAAFLSYYTLHYKWARGLRNSRLFLNKLVILTVCASVGVLALYFFYRYRYLGLPERFKSDEIGILVAEVPGDRQRQAQIAYVLAIQEAADKVPELRDLVKVRLLDRPLSPDPVKQSDEAAQIGRWLGAEFVVRPYAVEGFQTPWLTVVEQYNFSKRSSPIGKFKSLQLAQLDELPLPRNILLLARCILAASLYKRERYESAATEYQAVLGSHDLPELAPSRPDIELLLGVALIQEGKLHDAIDAFHVAIALNPDFWEAHLNLGSALDEMHKPEEAIAEFNKVIALKPSLAIGYFNLGNALMTEDHQAEALSRYDQALKLEPDLAGDVHIKIGNHHRDEKHYDQAVAEFQQAIDFYKKHSAPVTGGPEPAMAYANMGFALMDDKKYTEAMAALKQAASLGLDGDAVVRDAMGRTLFATGADERAKAEFREAIKRDQEYAPAYRGLEQCFLKEERHADLEEVMRQEVANVPKDAKGHYNLGTLLLENNQFKEAAIELSEAVKLDPDSFDSHRNLSAALRGEGLTKQAAAELQIANSIYLSIQMGNVVFQDQGLQNSNSGNQH